MAARDRLSVSLRTSVIAESSAVFIYVSVKLARLNVFSSLKKSLFFNVNYVFVSVISFVFSWWHLGEQMVLNATILANNEMQDIDTSS